MASWAWLAAMLGSIGGVTGTIPTLWCTLRGCPKDTQRIMIQNFNLSMLMVTMGTYLATGIVTRHAAAVRHRGTRHAGATLLGTRMYIGISEARFRQIVLGLLTVSGWRCWCLPCRSC